MMFCWIVLDHLIFSLEFCTNTNLWSEKVVDRDLIGTDRTRMSRWSCQTLSLRAVPLVVPLLKGVHSPPLTLRFVAPRFARAHYAPLDPAAKADLRIAERRRDRDPDLCAIEPIDRMHF